MSFTPHSYQIRIQFIYLDLCWGSKLITAQGPKKNNTLGYPVMKKGKKKEEKDEKSKELGSKDPWRENALNSMKQKKGPVGQNQ